MQILQAIILGLIQGLSEFIPVSSSGHLLLVGHYLNFSYSGLGFDTALDIGTLAALFLFFWKDFVELAKSIFVKDIDSRLAWILVVATIPGVVAGVVFESAIEHIHQSSAGVTVVAANLVVVGVIMLIADKYGRRQLDISQMNYKKGLTIGLAQALAIVPGVSRSGITITAGLAEGFDRVSATRFSFLLSAPIIAGATAKEVLKPSTLSQIHSAPLIYAFGIVAAALSGYLAIRFVLNYLVRHGLALFAYYRIIVGLLILVVVR
ncbi:MAG TPA: undecaprenyl-diphosphate phosphatase [Candidatus Nanoarchaeia archaeon]|nr:undecaprenyl-diphosphate phosphatase [Candidatus Nanoarchaeia archaeon]